MEFQFSQEQPEIRDLPRRFTEREMMPCAAVSDRLKSFPSEVHKRALELGLPSINEPESAGGGGLTCQEQGRTPATVA